MAAYFFNYLDELHSLLRNAHGLHSGKEIPMTNLMDLWTAETRKIAEDKKKIFLIGNGASATMAEHFGFDAMQNGKLNTVNFSETSYLTAISNDISFERLFLLKLERLAHPGDMLISISSSGNSPNIVKALEYAREYCMFTVTLSAMQSDNKSRQLGDLSIYVPAPTYGIAESAHSAIMHCWLDMYLERYIGGRH